jgi:hypothetical protein
LSVPDKDYSRMPFEISEFFSDMLETQQLLYFCYVTE